MKTTSKMFIIVTFLLVAFAGSYIAAGVNFMGIIMATIGAIGAMITTMTMDDNPPNDRR